MRVFDTKARIAAAVDAGLLVLIIVGLAFSPVRRGARSYRADIIEGSAAVATIRIDGDSPIELSREGEGWSLVDAHGRLPADAARVEAFLKAVDAVDSLEPVARDRASWAGLGLEEGSGQSVSLLDSKGSSLARFTLGDYAQSAGRVYLALEGSTAYLAPSGMASYVKGTRASWLDLRAFTQAVKVDDIQELAVKGSLRDGEGANRAFDYTIRRSGQAWESSDGRALDPGRVESSLRAFLALRGSDYAEAGLEEPGLLRAELRLGNGRSLGLSLGDRLPDGRFVAVSSQRDRALYLPAWAIAEALKPLEELAP